MTQMNKQASGGPDICACPDCDYETEKERGTPCRSVACPECGAKLVAKVEEVEMTIAQQQAIETARAVVNDSKMLAQVAEAKGVSPQQAANKMLDELERELAEAKMKTVAGKKRPASDFLVVEDPDKVSTWYLPVKVNGKINHNLMGAAWAALHGGYRGSKYEGPDKAAAIKKLTALYKAEDMETPAIEAAMDEAYGDDEVYVSYAITSFADLQAAEQTNEAAERMRTLTYQFKELISNIMFSSEVEDKAEALRTLTGEFTELISGKIEDVKTAGSAELGEMEEVFIESAADLALGQVADFTGDFAELGIEAAIESGRRAPVLVDFRIIEPGPGNKRNNNYYPRPMLRECAPIFEGMDIFATDHLEAERNERTKVGRVQECPIRFTESGAPVGRVIIYDPGQAEKTRNRADAGELATMEGSIYASGIARAGKVDGVEYKVVEAITAGKYLELVSKAGAGGQALNLAEVNGGDEMKDEKKTDEQADVEEVEIQEGDEQSVEGETPDTEPVEETSEPECLSEAAVSTALDETNLPGAFKAALSKGAYADAEGLGTAITEAIAEVKALTGSGQVFGQGNTKPVEEKVLTADERELQSLLSFNETMREAGCGEVPIPADLQYLIEGGK